MTARYASRIAALSLALVAGAHASDAPPIDVAHAAQAAYDRGVATLRTDPQASAAAFRESIEAWERLRATGIRNGELEFNLGNARLQSACTSASRRGWRSACGARCGSRSGPRRRAGSARPGPRCSGRSARSRRCPGEA